MRTGLTAILQRKAWRNMVTYSGTIADLVWEDLDFDYLTDSRHFHLSSFYLQKGLRPRVPELLQKIKAAGLTTSMDTNDDPEDTWEGGLQEALPHLDFFLPNEREAQKATATTNLEDALTRLAAVVPLVVVKRGPSGAMAQRGTERFTSPARKVNPVDAVGAGDSFDAGFLDQYLKGGDLPACLAAGNLAGAFSTTRPGGTEAFRDAKHREQFYREQSAIQ